MSNTQTIGTVVTKIFDSTDSMQASTELSAGMVCETLGFYEKGDGGGAKYIIEDKGESVANAIDVFAIGIDEKNNYSLVAKFFCEGKPVNVLQFGAKNNYVTNASASERNDSTAIQRAIEYTDEKLFGNSENPGGDINCIIVPGGTYIIHDQISMPPYMQMYLEGDVQFFSNVTADEQIYKYSDLTMPSTDGYTVTTSEDTNNNYTVAKKDNVTVKISKRKTDGKIVRIDTTTTTNMQEIGTKDVTVEMQYATMDEISNDSFDTVCAQKEVFAKNNTSFMKDGQKVTVATKYNGDEYHVYKKGIIKICERYNDDGKRRDPYFWKNSKRYSISPHVNSEVFCGNGSLEIHNKIIGNNDSVPPYVCGIEIGDYTEYARLTNQQFPTYEGVSRYDNLRFSNLKILYCNVGILSRAICYYTNVISDTEFYQNKIGFQFGVYGENDIIKTTQTFVDVPVDSSIAELNANTTVTSGIVGEGAYNCGEMNHFRACLFTGNKISVNILLSSLSATFTSCHFDFENCVFRAAYRTNLTVDKCHIEGTGKDLKDKYFPDGFMTEDLTSSFKSRAQNDPMDEFVGIMYAKPLTEFGGSQVDQYSYVDLNITSSRIVDTYDMPWSVFSYYNSGTATYSDGHFRSRIYLDNNKYTYAKSAPISYLTTEDNGIIHSGFLLSEFPETTAVSSNANDEMRYEKYACQNVPVISRDSAEYGSYYSASEPRKNHRFLSNRTLANKYPYLQNVTYSTEEGYTGVNIGFPDNDNDISYLILRDGRYPKSPFKKYDNNAKLIQLCTKYITLDKYTEYENDQKNGMDVFPKTIVEFDNDLISCQKGDSIYASVVTDRIAFNTNYIENTTVDEDKIITKASNSRIPITNNIIVTELDNEGNVNGSYKYDIPYSTSDIEEFEMTTESTTSTDIEPLITIDKDYNYDYSLAKYVSTNALKHIVVHENTSKIKFILNAYFPLMATINSDSNAQENYCICALLVEKNT